MGKKLLVLAAVFTAVVLFSSAAFAMDPLGPPTAGLKMLQSDFGIEYLFSRMDIKMNNGLLHSRDFVIVGSSPTAFVHEPLPNLVMKPAEQNKIYGRLGFGVTDDWEVFVRLGAADIADETSGAEIDGDYGFSGGAGTKITFAKSEDGKLTWGALAQFSWTKTDFESFLFTGTIPIEGTPTPAIITEKTEVEYFEYQFAVGPTYKPTPGVSIYGGPVVHFLQGTLDDKLTGLFTSGPSIGQTGSFTASWDLKQQKSILGGYVGTQIDITKNTSLNVEGQFGSKMWAVGGGIAWKF